MLIKFKRPLTVYLDNDSEFIFRDGFSYEYNKVDDGIIVWNVDNWFGLVDIKEKLTM